MRICACALLRIMRLGAFCADYSYYAHIMRMCAYYAYSARWVRIERSRIERSMLE